MQFEIVHAGWAFNEETAFLLARYPNVWGNLPCAYWPVPSYPEEDLPGPGLKRQFAQHFHGQGRPSN